MTTEDAMRVAVEVLEGYWETMDVRKFESEAHAAERARVRDAAEALREELEEGVDNTDS